MPAVSGKELLMAVVGAVADGQPVDWSRAESTPLSDEERSLLAQLKVLEGLHRLHRSGTPSSSHGGPLDRETSTMHVAGRQMKRAADKSDTHVLTASAPTPRAWGPLEIRNVLGVGGFGVVYQAWDPHLASDVALKVLTSETAGAGATVVQEARLLARVRHPNIVSIYGAERSGGQVGLWMELVRGRTLKQLVKQQGIFSAREAALVGLDLTRALAAVHGAGLVHRDVKPHNVMRDDSGRIVLMDFGAGIELTELSDDLRHKHVGTPLYMAPELFAHQQPSPQTDLYSLGILLYHLVTGAYPIEGAGPEEVELQHVRGERRRLRDARPDLPIEFVRIVERASDPDPGRRYASAGAMEADLVQFVVQDDRAALPRAAAGSAGVVPPRQSWRGNRAMLTAAAIAVLVAAGVSTATFRAWRRAAPGVAPVAALRSLAVLPLRNVSGDPGQDYFVDGMSELLTADLSGVSALRVTADSATAGYRGTKKSAAEIGRELHVDGVVEGSVARSGDRVRVTVQVIQAGTNLSVWGASFEREASDAFRLQADITRTLVSELKAVLTTGERKRLEQTYVARPEVQDLYLRARADIHTYDRTRLREARSLLERAVQLDPNYALAWASLARAYTLLQAWGELSPAESRRLGVAAARTAIQRDPAMFEAHSTLAEALFKFDWNWSEADVHYREALDANPSFSMGRWQYARFLSAEGRVDEAVAQARRAEETDPLSTDVKGTVAMMLVYQRQYAQAEAKALEAMVLEPNQQGPHMIRGRALASLERYDESIRELQEAVRLSTGSPSALAELGRVYAVAGRREEAVGILERLSRPLSSAGGFVNGQDAAYVQLGLGRYDEALAGFARAVDQKSERILWLRVDPRLDPLRNDARFQRLVTRIGGS